MQKCRVCDHAERSRIDELIREKTPTLTLHRTFGLSRPSIDRHRENHVTKRKRTGPKRPPSGGAAAPLALDTPKRPTEVLPPEGEEGGDPPPETFKDPEDILRHLESLFSESQKQLELARENPVLFQLASKELRATLHDLKEILREVDRDDEDADLLRHPAWARIRKRILAALVDFPEAAAAIARAFAEELGMEFVE